MDAFAAIIAFDNASLHAVQSAISEPLTWVMLGITFLGNPVFWVIVAALIYWKGKENESFFLMNLIVFTALVTGALKAAFLRQRPSPETFRVLGTDDFGQFAFPSGHSALIAAACSHYWGFLKKNQRLAFAILVGLVAFSRLYLGMHFLSDVIAGIAIGLAIGKLNLLARNRLFHLNFRPSKLEDEIVLVGAVMLAVLGVFFLQPFPLSAALIGFYAGFFLFKEMGLEQARMHGRKSKAKYLCGFAFLAAILVATGEIPLISIKTSNAEQFALYLIAGFWISWLWPFLWEKIAVKKNR
ncbi:MAG: phosphatase PAP2 family protein [Candidatus Diapherotrites archaeon]|nr:phosphatase PAP2 family protein [Candidatus Diapherotrites archaeon]